jgi:voltage-gated potassium channel
MAAYADRRAAGPYALFILILSLIGLLVVGLQVTVPLDSETRTLLEYADLALCAVFFGDFAYTLHQARDRWHYLRTWGWIDLLSSVPAIDAFRAGRAVRVLRVIRVLRAVKSATILWRFLASRAAQSAVLASVLLTTLTIFVGSVGILHLERDGGGSIDTAGDALWWVLCTLTTVGYGDLYPVTAGGRAAAAGIMLVGIGAFATTAGAIATRLSTIEESARGESAREDEILARLAAIEALLERRLAAPGDR